METNLFLHFGPNTFTGVEWGDGKESEEIFQPSALDCRQWVSVAKAAGFKGVIITAKHHDGFCLWPNPESTHTVAQSSWRDGKGDVLRELSDACREADMKFGVYVSPWDRNHPSYGTPEYNQVFVRTLEHIYANYGEIFEQWFDGACGEGPNGKKQVYDWDLFNGTVFREQPQAVIFSDAGPGCRWVGNEEGHAGRTNWSTIDKSSLFPGKGGINDLLNQGVEGAPDWAPAETDVSIRNGWFWRNEDEQSVRSADNVFDIWERSVGGNSILLLNVPPDRQGRIAPRDSAVLAEVGARIRETYSNDLLVGANLKIRRSGRRMTEGGRGICSYEYTLPRAIRFDRLKLREDLSQGERIESFALDVWADGWQEVARGTNVGNRRILRFPEQDALRLRVRILSARAIPKLDSISAYLTD